MKILLIYLCLCFLSFCASATDWSKDAELPSGNEKFSPYHRGNILELSEHELKSKILAGRGHALHYPVEVTELTIPYQAFKNYLESENSDPFKKFIFSLTKEFAPFQDMESFRHWLGLQAYPTDASQQFPSEWPDIEAEEKSVGMGATLIHKKGAEALTFSCAACHSAELFGKKIIGLTNRFPRANEFFRHGKNLAPLIPSAIFKNLTQATQAEVDILTQTKKAVHWVGVKKPQNLGLDTSLAQVALSLSRRGLDEYATRFTWTSVLPRPNALSEKVADSKPAVWWNLKYKTRWLSDGSIVQGNPVFTNFLWNEIGRGIDLKKLEQWMLNNQDKVDELTAAVFATEAPFYLDFFSEETLNLDQAMKGEKHFVQNCQGCHGQYQKAWNDPLYADSPLKEKTKTLSVWYHKKTPVKDVGTDPGRYEGVQYFASDLNRLKISKTLQTIVEPQKGYVPPPLVGIWSRWPYLHNNSIPHLCALLTRAKDRPVLYVAGPAVNPTTDFDPDCVGYPQIDKAPAAWKKNPDYWYDTKKEGLSNRGHEQGILTKEGEEKMTPKEKRELIEFLKTL